MPEQRFGGLVGHVHRLGAAAADRLGGRDAAWRRTLAPWVGRALHAVTFGRGVVTVVNGTRLRIDPRHRVFLQPDYEAKVATFLRARVMPGQCCLDVGAHIGAYALQMAHWTGPAGRVIAFEPNPGTARVLRRHIRMNGLSGVVTVEDLAVGAAAGTANLIGSPGSGMSRLGAANPELTGTDLTAIRVPVVTLDRYCAAHAVVPDCLVIDVEGYEFGVLEGAEGLLRQRGASLAIVAEMHPAVWGLSGWSREGAEALLRSLGRRPVGLTGQTDPLGEYGSVALV